MNNTYTFPCAAIILALTLLTTAQASAQSGEWRDWAGARYGWDLDREEVDRERLRNEQVRQELGLGYRDLQPESAMLTPTTGAPRTAGQGSPTLAPLSPLATQPQPITPSPVVQPRPVQTRPAQVIPAQPPRVAQPVTNRPNARELAAERRRQAEQKQATRHRSHAERRELDPMCRGGPKCN